MILPNQMRTDLLGTLLPTSWNVPCSLHPESAHNILGSSQPDDSSQGCIVSTDKVMRIMPRVTRRLWLRCPARQDGRTLVFRICGAAPGGEFKGSHSNCVYPTIFCELQQAGTTGSIDVQTTSIHHGRATKRISRLQTLRQRRCIK